MLLFTRTPVSEVCPNHKVVMFQPRIETSPDLVSVSIVKLIYILPRPTFFNLVMDILFPPCYHS